MSGEWVIVPKEPTDTQRDAGLEFAGRVRPYEAPRESGVPVECDISPADAEDINNDTRQHCADIYSAMLSASPPPPVTLDEVTEVLEEMCREASANVGDGPTHFDIHVWKNARALLSKLKPKE